MLAPSKLRTLEGTSRPSWKAGLQPSYCASKSTTTRLARIGHLEVLLNSGLARLFRSRTTTVDSRWVYEYEPNYESVSLVRWRIGLTTEAAMGIAGICREHTNPDGEAVFAMSMLALNAEIPPLPAALSCVAREKR